MTRRYNSLVELISQARRLQVLAEIADRGSFSAAAASLEMTQSAVSQHISALERAVGMAVVDRTSRPPQLTEAGAALVRHTRAVLTRLDAAEQELAAVAGRRLGRVRLGAFPTALATFVPAALATFKQRVPTVTLSVVDDHMPQLLRRLGDGEIDLAIVYGHKALPDLASGEFERIHLFDDPFRAVLPRAHHLARKGTTILLSDLSNETWIGGSTASGWFRIVRQACREAGFEPNVALTSDDYVGIQALVAANLGVTVLPGLATTHAPSRVEVREIRSQTPVRRIWVARPDDAYPSPSAQVMIDTLQQTTRRRAATALT
jgi:DNA-binding transcriptional LysR family regulator